MIAGQGAKGWQPGELIGKEETYRGAHLDYVGHVFPEQRFRLMSQARAVFVPTIFVEPFGGVSVEAQLCGTPVISTDGGAFPETVEHGRTGFRCHTLDHFVWAAKNVHTLDRAYIRRRALSLYSLDRVGAMFEEYFQMCTDLWERGWDTLRPERTRLDWLNPLAC